MIIASSARSHREASVMSHPSVTCVFFWRGGYAGFLVDDLLFAATGRYLGWLERDRSVWRADGSWLGTLVDERYVLREERAVARARRTPRVPPVIPQAPAAPGSLLPRAPRPGWADALAEMLRVPQATELQGEWRDGEALVRFSDDGRFVRRAVDGAVDEAGEWAMGGAVLRVRADGDGAARLYQVIEYTGASLALYWLTSEARSIPFTLWRVQEE